MIEKEYCKFSDLKKELGTSSRSIDRIVTAFKIPRYSPNGNKAVLAKDLEKLKACIALMKQSRLKYEFVSRLEKHFIDELLTKVI